MDLYCGHTTRLPRWLYDEVKAWKAVPWTTHIGGFDLIAAARQFAAPPLWGESFAVAKSQTAKPWFHIAWRSADMALFADAEADGQARVVFYWGHQLPRFEQQFKGHGIVVRLK